MSTERKEKAVETVVMGNLVDDADDFFVKKRKKRIVHAYSPVRSPSPAIVVVGDSDDDDEIRERTKKTRAPPKKKVQNDMPDWTRTNKSTTRGQERKKSRSVARGSTEERKSRPTNNEPITIGSSPEKEDRKKRKPLELTPPPEMTERKKAEIAQAVQSAITLKPRPQASTSMLVTDDGQGRNGEASKVTEGETIQIYFRMVAPSERKQGGSSKAVEHYEKRRAISIGRSQPLEHAVNALAAQIRKPANDIVVTYRGDRLYSVLLTPQYLGIDDDAEFVCYEKDVYARLDAVSRAPPPPMDEQEEDDANGSQSSEPPIEINEKVRINLHGEFGPVTATVQPHVTAANLCKYYLKKHDKDTGLAKRYRLKFDGETIDPDTKFADMDVETGDQIDVVKA